MAKHIKLPKGIKKPDNRAKGHDKSGTRGQRKRFSVVQCSIHKTVACAYPTSRKESVAGCPLCKKKGEIA